MAFLDKNGLEKLWAHIVSKFATKEELQDIDVQDEIYIGDGELPEGYTLQINPEGDAAVLASIPSPSTDKVGQVIKVQADGTYGLAEDLSGLTEISANNVSAGTFAGQTVANSEAVANISVAQVRNIYGGTEDLTAGTSPLATGEVYICYE